MNTSPVPAVTAPREVVTDAFLALFKRTFGPGNTVTEPQRLYNRALPLRRPRS